MERYYFEFSNEIFWLAAVEVNLIFSSIRLKGIPC